MFRFQVACFDALRWCVLGLRQAWLTPFGGVRFVLSLSHFELLSLVRSPTFAAVFSPGLLTAQGENCIPIEIDARAQLVEQLISAF